MIISYHPKLGLSLGYMFPATCVWLVPGTSMDTFMATVADVEEYLYSHSVCDIAQDAECTPDEVYAWLIANQYIREKT
jgi:hypothetical protein